MKKYFLVLCFISVQYITAQVGIGTTVPTEMLEVVGDVLLTDTMETQLITDALSTEDDFKFLARANNSVPVGLIKRLESDNIDVTPIRMQKYRFHNIFEDNATDIDLGLDDSDYIVSIADFKWVGPGLKKKTGRTGLFTLNVARDGSGNWHLKIQNTPLRPFNAGDIIEYEVTLYIYQTTYFKSMSTVRVNLGGANSGSFSGYGTNNGAGEVPTIFQ